MQHVSDAGYHRSNSLKALAIVGIIVVAAAAFIWNAAGGSRNEEPAPQSVARSSGDAKPLTYTLEQIAAAKAEFLKGAEDRIRLSAAILTTVKANAAGGSQVASAIALRQARDQHRSFRPLEVPVALNGNKLAEQLVDRVQTLVAVRASAFDSGVDYFGRDGAAGDAADMFEALERAAVLEQEAQALVDNLAALPRTGG